MRRRFLNHILKNISSNYSEYFTIEALEDGLTAKLSVNSCEYRVNHGTWSTLLPDTETVSINTGLILQFKGNLIPNSSDGIGTFSISKLCDLKGNIMSLLYGDNFINQVSLTGESKTFALLFDNCSTIKNAENLILPAMILTNSCYYLMFRGCTNLITAPKLPAIELTERCYLRMFGNCTSLTKAPELPATILSKYCYYYMFTDCTSLVIAPELPATTLAIYCYNYMFQNCTSLTIAPELPANELVASCYSRMFKDCNNLNYIKMLATNISATNCLSNWVSGVSSTGTFVKHKNMTTLKNGASGIPIGWTIENYVNSNGFDFVDLGLPSGTLWATSPIMNANNEPLYFQWGDTEGWTAEQIENGEKEFVTSDYKFGEYPFTKYNAEDSKIVLDLEDDAVHVHMGGDWHIPTKEQFEELIANTTSIWITQNDIDGRLFTSNINGESIFISAFGFTESSYINLDDSITIWSNSVGEDDINESWFMESDSSNININLFDRSWGLPVFGVIG